MSIGSRTFYLLGDSLDHNTLGVLGLHTLQISAQGPHPHPHSLPFTLFSHPLTSGHTHMEQLARVQPSEHAVYAC